MKIDYKKIMEYLLKNCPWHKSDLHGLSHWRNVERNGLFLAETNHADKELIRLFAMFHDCKRQNDWSDPEHGPRAADFIMEINDELLQLETDRLEKLAFACRYHTHRDNHIDPTISCCWDADRLDIMRAGIIPEAKFYSTKAAQKIVKKDYWDGLWAFKYETVIKKG